MVSGIILMKFKISMDSKIHRIVNDEAETMDKIVRLKKKH